MDGPMLYYSIDGFDFADTMVAAPLGIRLLGMIPSGWSESRGL
jgi:hypothetical protein